jgi:hypothetical protein
VLPFLKTQDPIKFPPKNNLNVADVAVKLCQHRRSSSERMVTVYTPDWALNGPPQRRPAAALPEMWLGCLAVLSFDLRKIQLHLKAPRFNLHRAPSSPARNVAWPPWPSSMMRAPRFPAFPINGHCRLAGEGGFIAVTYLHIMLHNHAIVTVIHHTLPLYNTLRRLCYIACYFSSHVTCCMPYGHAELGHADMPQ